ncbi:MAG: nucleotidyltransferase domain-containing protein [Nitrospirae bacterium]|nr:nucleotidyltransferase domain-containing protein [Magnetococcales bacterium]HAT49549.1 DNA polymerase III subunit beta [Alphaproteobacteria bacterium]
MRLTTQDLQAIEEAARDFFAPGSVVRLFGSRLDDQRRGGDIDLLIESPVAMASRDQVARRNGFLARLYRRLGEQKIDVLIVAAGEPDERSIVQTARRVGQVIARVPQ